MKKKVFIFCLVFIITLLYSVFIRDIEFDEVWNYGFSYNISKGLIIYRDFNAIQTPLYFIISSLFIKIFGNYIISVHIFDALLIGGIIIMLYEIIKNKVFILYPVIILYTTPSYNLLCMFLIVLILYLMYKKKDNNILIGLIIGFSFITKQTVGICLLVPYLFYSKDKIKSIISFAIPFLILSIYLVFNSAFLNFFDYCFLGMLDFGKNNTNINILFIIELIMCFILVILLIRSRIRDKFLFYILAYQIIGFPLGDIYHFTLMVSLVLFYYLYKFNYKINIILGLLLYYVLILFNLNGINTIKDDNYLYLRNVPKGFYYSINDEYNSYNKFDSEYKFIVSGDAYFVKLYGDVPINKYDLLLNGNMGYDGNKKYISDINKKCNDNKCLFYIYKYTVFDKSNQLSKDIYDYVLDNYNLISEDSNYNIYGNFNVY